MSLRLKNYGVSLNFLYQSLGSGRVELQEAALLYLTKQNLLNSTNENDEYTRFCNEFLHQIIFNGTLAWRLDVTSSTTSSNKDVVDWKLLYKFEWVQVYSILAILAQANSFKTYGESKLEGQITFVTDLKANGNLDLSSQKLLDYLVTGRALVANTIAYDWRYCYFTNNEVIKMLEVIKYYNTNRGIAHLAQLQREKDRWHIQNQVISWQSIFKEILEQEQDFFGIIA